MVVWKKLGEVCSFNRGRTITSKDTIEGNIPVIAGGQSPSYYHNESNRCGESIAVAGSGAYAGFISYWNQPIFVSDAFTVDPRDNISHKYLFHWLKMNQANVYATQKGAGVPHVHGKDIANFLIPIPSLSEQSRIVGILDTFTASIDNLKAQIAQHRKQYEYYRDQLLDLEGKEGVEMKTIKEVFDTRNGYTPSTNNSDYWENGIIPWFKMEDIRDKGRILDDSILHITPKAIKGKGLFKANSIILATSATIGEHALINVEHLCNQRFTNFFTKKKFEEKVNMKFVYYYMYKIDEWCKQHVNQGGFASVDMGGLYNHYFPLLSLEEQRRIVSILDTFEASITNLESQLKAREQQYEYYRNKLLTFE